MKCAITGVNGYLGGQLKVFFSKQGWEVLGLTHRGDGYRQGNNEHFNLKSGIKSESLAGTDVLIHCAYDFSLKGWEEILEVNVQGSIKLFQSAKRADVKKIIFISSMSAFEKCQSY